MQLDIEFPGLRRERERKRFKDTMTALRYVLRNRESMDMERLFMKIASIKQFLARISYFRTNETHEFPYNDVC